jgi:hypothetical protein
MPPLPTPAVSFRLRAPDLAITYEVTLHGVATIGSVGAEPLTADR